MFLTYFLIIACCLSFEVPTEAAVQKNPIAGLLTPENKPTPALQTLLELDGVFDPNDSLPTIVQKTQKWVAVNKGARGTERRDLVDDAHYQAIRDRVVEAACSAGLFKGSAPLLKHYDYGICLGAFLPSVRERLANLIKAWESGVHFDQLIFLSGERTLRKGSGEPDDPAALCNPQLSPLPLRVQWQPSDIDHFPYETEYDMVKLVWEQVEIPSDMREVLQDNIVFINAPRGDAARASTDDTFVTWLKRCNPAPGSILAASHPLVWNYQHLVGMRVLGSDYFLDAIALPVTDKQLSAHQSQLTGLILDTVAKILYEHELICRKSPSN